MARRKSYRGVLFVFCLVWGTNENSATQAWAQSAPGQTSPAAATGTTGQGAAGTTGASGTKPADSGAVAKPSITAILVTAPSQTLTLSGSDLQDKLTVTLTDPQGNIYPATVVSRDAKRVVVSATPGLSGQWKVSASNPGGPTSDASLFVAGGLPALDKNSPAFLAFAFTAGAATLMLFGLLVFVIYDVRKVQTDRQWSFGDALSEESRYQPPEIREKKDVITFASTSRLIALIGMMGILAIVVGIGYSVMWNLYIYGTVPDLSQVRSFLYGAACLFAPYLANRLSGMRRPGAKADGGEAAVRTEISGVVPPSFVASAAEQALQVTGSGFQRGLSLTFTDPAGGPPQVVSGDAITAVTPTLAGSSVVLNTPGTWKVAVTNPAEEPSGDFVFTVMGAPTVKAISPAQPKHKAEAQRVEITGSGFMSGLTVEFTSPGRTTVAGSVASVNATHVLVDVQLAEKGDWKVVASNRGNRASAAFEFNVG